MLAQDTVYVWLFRLDSQIDDALWLRWRGWLSSAEIMRAESFRAEQHRREYILAHAGLRFVLGKCLGILPEQVVFAGDEGLSGKKPALAKDEEVLGLRFNLSHTAGVALVGVALEREVGVDIERIRGMHDLKGMARSVMSDEELYVWSALDDAEREAAFYRLWTRKEAYLKAIGLGLYRSLQDVTVPVSSTLKLEGSKVKDVSETGDWVVCDLASGEGYSASICCEGREMLEVRVETLDAVVDFQ